MGLWLQIDENKIEDLESGSIFAVKAEDDAQLVRTWKVIHHMSRQTAANSVLAEGYKTHAEAQDALSQLLSELGIEPARIQPPVTDEETAAKEDVK